MGRVRGICDLLEPKGVVPNALYKEEGKRGIAFRQRDCYVIAQTLCREPKSGSMLVVEDSENPACWKKEGESAIISQDMG